MVKIKDFTNSWGNNFYALDAYGWLRITRHSNGYDKLKNTLIFH